MGPVGNGVIELKVNDNDGWFRVLYVAKFATGVYVLAFQKRTNKAAPADLEMGKARYKLLLEELNKQEQGNAQTKG
jgi:phage-related protein